MSVLRGAFGRSVVVAVLVVMAILTAQAEPMSVEDYAKTASRTAVMANLCPRYFKLNVEQMRQWRRIAIEVGKQLSEEFDAKLKSEIKRRNAEVDRAGHRVWCIRIQGQYVSRGIDIEAPTKPYEEEAEAAVERMKAEAGDRAKAQEEAQGTPKRLPKPSLYRPGIGATVFCRQLGSINHPLMASKLRSKWSRLGLSYGSGVLMLNLRRASTWPVAIFCVFTLPQPRDVTKVDCTIHIVDDKVIRAAGYEPDVIRRHEIGHCNGWPADHRGARAP